MHARLQLSLELAMALLTILFLGLLNTKIWDGAHAKKVS